MSKVRVSYSLVRVSRVKLGLVGLVMVNRVSVMVSFRVSCIV